MSAQTERRSVPIENLPRLIAEMLRSYRGNPVTPMQIAMRLTEALDALVQKRDVDTVLKALKAAGVVSTITVPKREGSNRTRHAYYVGALNNRGKALR